MNTREFNIDGFSDEIFEVVHQLGELRDLELEHYISDLIRRSDAVKFAKEILRYLEMINEVSTKLSEKDKTRNDATIKSLYESLHSRSLTPMERRFVYEEIADLIRDMESIRSYWKLKTLTGLKFMGAGSAVLAAGLFLRKKKK
jgi:flagellin-specific chaperone FliS